MATETVPEIAEIVAGHTLVRKVGEGAMAEVWEAWDPAGGTVALKLLKPERALDPECVRDFENEADATRAAEHGFVVKVFARGVDAGRHWISMEFVDGPSLADYLGKVGRIPVKAAISVTTKVARALRHAHGLGLVHRDVKPDNILLFRNGDARLTDFGIVKDVSTLKGYLLPGRKVGTPAYASPEQCLGKRLSPATDVYSLGASLYHMITGRTPFGGGTRSEIMRRHVSVPLVAPIDVVPTIPRSLSKLVERMMAKKVLDRTPDMDRVIQDLTLIREGKVPVVARRRR